MRSPLNKLISSILLVFSSFLWTLSPAQGARGTLPLWTSVEQLITRYVFFHSGTYVQLILPARRYENTEPLSMMWCFSRNDLSFAVELVGSPSEPVIPLVLQVEPSAGPRLTPHCHSTKVRNYSTREPTRVSLNYLTSGPTLPYRGFSHELNFWSQNHHSQTPSSPESLQFGILHLWTKEVEITKPTAAFVCLATTTPVSHAIFKSSQGQVSSRHLAKDLGFGCYSFGDFVFAASGTYTVDLFGGAANLEPVKISSFSVTI
jgi:hypothetical protein